MAIEVRGLRKAFGDKVVLDGFSCAFADGETTCVMGPSGIGKTTLINILMGLETPDAGEITGLAGLRLAAVFQEDRLLENMDAVDNVRLVTGKARGREEIREALVAIGLADGLGQPCRELSGGMRRRVAIVRALLAAWDLLVLDEPFKGLDEGTRAVAIDFVRGHSEGRTVVMITHDAAEAAAMGGRVVHMEG